MRLQAWQNWKWTSQSHRGQRILLKKSPSHTPKNSKILEFQIWTQIDFKVQKIYVPIIVFALTPSYVQANASPRLTSMMISRLQASKNSKWKLQSHRGMKNCLKISFRTRRKSMTCNISKWHADRFQGWKNVCSDNSFFSYTILRHS